MVTINWCKKQKQGLALIDPNNNLANEYIKSAQETLSSLDDAENSNMWKATKKYYAQYFAVYAICMKIGFKCEIHDCTIELIRYLKEFEIFPPDAYNTLKVDKQLRIDNQYYLKNIPVDFNYDELLSFVLFCKNKIHSLQNPLINKIRLKI